MPFRPEHSLLRVEVPALHTIDTSSVENLFGMWSLFSKASDAMEDGKRLENLSWRLWNRETFCCQKSKYSSRKHSSHACATQPRPTKAQSAASAPTNTDIPMPELSSSLDSASSEDEIVDSQDSSSDEQGDARPELRRHSNQQARGKHITSMDLEKIVLSIKETKDFEPIELPMSMKKTATQDFADQSTTTSQATLLESSASTVATDASAKSSQTIGSPDSSSTEMSGHSIVRGFVPGGAPSSYRSQTHLAPAQPTPILKTSPQYHGAQPKKKGAMFTIGTSSGEDESSLDSHMRTPGSMPKSELSESLRRGTSSMLKKTTSFKDEIAHQRIIARHSPVFESDDEDEDVSESAIEDDDDSSEWEDSDDNNSGPSSINEQLFQRVDSRPNLTSRRSLLTTLMHEPDRAKALANAASRSSPAIRRSRVTSPNGPSLATTPENPPTVESGTRPQPIIMTTSNMHQQLALSPRTTRRNMLSTELTESLRKNLLWERQHKSTGNLAALKRRHTAVDMKNLKEASGPTYPTKDHNASFTNDYFNAGLGEYHSRGW